jgi:hypothetical protein
VNGSRSHQRNLSSDSYASIGPLPGDWETTPRVDLRLYRPIIIETGFGELELGQYYTVCRNLGCNALLPRRRRNIREHLEICMFHNIRGWTAPKGSSPQRFVHYETRTERRTFEELPLGPESPNIPED